MPWTALDWSVYWPRSNPACAPTRPSSETRASQAFGRALAITAAATHGASSGTGATEGGSPGRTCGPTANALAGPLHDVITLDVTAAVGRCGNCDRTGPWPMCGSSTTPRRGRPLSHLRPGPPADGARPRPRLADLRGLTYLQLPVPEEASALDRTEQKMGSHLLNSCRGGSSFLQVAPDRRGQG
jgi:hypothetical protein